MFSPGRRKRDPIELLLSSHAGRIPELLPLKWARMALSPFAFLRGAAQVMAADIGSGRNTGLRVELCGDAHIRNLGAYAAPDGHLVFDINDFDQAYPGPLEWDLKRLAASIVLTGREAGEKESSCKEATYLMARAYREAMLRFSMMPAINIFRFEINRLPESNPAHAVLKKAERQTPSVTFEKLVKPGPRPAFLHQPPLLARLNPKQAERLLSALGAYRETVTHNRRLVLDAYRPADAAFKVVGTGSVGLRNYVVLTLGMGTSDPLFIQIKEAEASCWAPFARSKETPGHHGQRVAQAQLRMQTVSDPFLGWTTHEGRPYLVRQLADHKAAVETEELKGQALFEYCSLTGELFAKAHARTGDPAAISGYLGNSGRFENSIARFGVLYADQTESDHEQLLAALRSGRLKS